MDERKAKVINDTVGREASALADSRSRYERGRDVLAEISSVPADAPQAGYALLAPTTRNIQNLYFLPFAKKVLTL